MQKTNKHAKWTINDLQQIISPCILSPMPSIYNSVDINDSLSESVGWNLWRRNWKWGYRLQYIPLMQCRKWTKHNKNWGWKETSPQGFPVLLLLMSHTGLKISWLLEDKVFIKQYPTYFPVRLDNFHSYQEMCLIISLMLDHIGHQQFTCWHQFSTFLFSSWIWQIALLTHGEGVLTKAQLRRLLGQTAWRSPWSWEI